MKTAPTLSRAAAFAALVIALGLTGCPKSEPATPPPPSAPAPKPEAPPAEETCVNRWLTAHALDEYGNAQGTMYAGGSPLFDEATGKTQERLAYVYGKQPDARKACAP